MNHDSLESMALDLLPKLRTKEQEEAQAAKMAAKVAREDTRVAGGTYRPKPVNREASMLLAKAPWYAHAPQLKRGANMTNMNKVLPEGDNRAKSHDEERADADLGAAIVGRLEAEIPKARLDYLARANKVEEDLESATRSICNGVTEFARVTDEHKKVLTERRMGIVNDCSSMMNALKDVRNFFLSREHEEEVRRLSEFVDLCERLDRLKESGFLDSVVDTMLKLEVKNDA